MVGQRKVAATASQGVAAVPALHQATAAPAVQVQHYLLPCLEGERHCPTQGAAEDAPVSLLQLLPQVYYPDPGQGLVGGYVFAKPDADAVGQLQQLKGMGPLSQVMEMVPGLSSITGRISEAELSDDKLNRVEAVIRSMTATFIPSSSMRSARDGPD